jgi:hypothetical protein
MENRGRQKDRGKGSGNRGNSRKGRSKSRLGKIECWNCGKKGHLKKDCRAPKKQRDGQQERNQKANVTGDVLQDALILFVDNIFESWVVDSGASFHATPHRKHFLDYVQGDFGQVHLGDNKPCKIVGMGKVKIKQRNGNQWLLKEVKHVPDLRKNLISTGQLASEGCISIFTDKTWKVIKGSLVIAKGEKVGTLYLCTGNIDSSISLASTGVDTTLWHHRLGHMSEKGMQILHKRNLLPDLKQIDLDFCEHCVYGKQKRVIFLRVGKEKKNERLELVQVQTCMVPMQVDTKKKWEQGMKEEMDSLENNQTWDLVQLPAGKRALQNKWVYKLKEEDGGEKRYKDRLVVKGFAQKKGIDFDEIFSPVVKMTSIRTILSLVAVEDLHLEQLDVKTTFLHGDLEEEIYMQQPQGYEVKGKENLVCRLKKSLYGLKQAPRQWYLKFDRFMTEQGYSRCHSDHCVYFKKLENGSFIILLLYVDDMLVAGSNMQDINVLKKKLANSFAMKDLGAAKKILGMRITRDRKNRKLTLSQGEYTEKVLERFRMQNAKPVSTPLAIHFKLTKEMCPKT